MLTARRATIWEAGLVAACVGAAAALAPAPSLALLAPLGIALAMSALVRDLRPRPIDGATLALVALVWAAAGQELGLLTALAWRSCAETRGWAGAPRAPAADPAIAAALHRWAGVTAALVWRASESPAVGWALAACVAVIWLDWLIRRLADWRLGELDRDRYQIAAQHLVLVSLIAALPSIEAALAAITAMALVRKARLPSGAALQVRR